MYLKRIIAFLSCFALFAQPLIAGLSIVRSNGVTVTGTDGITYVGTSGVTVSGTDGYLSYISNGISITDINGNPVTGVDGVSVSGADGVTHFRSNGVSVSGADGVSVSGADGVTVTGTDGVTVTGTDGTDYSADYVLFQHPTGVTVTGTDGVSISGADGVQLVGSDGVTVSGTDGIVISGTDGISVSGADGIRGFGSEGLVFELVSPTGVSVSGADGVSISGADGVSVSGADSIDLISESEIPYGRGLQGFDPELAILLNQITDDSNVNAVIAFHQYPGPTDISQLRKNGILGGTKYEVIPVVSVTATKAQLIAVSRLPNVRSIYGNRTIEFNADPYFEETVHQRVAPDDDLTANNGGLPVTGRNVTVAVLDTGVNSQHSDLVGKVVQNVKLVDSQSVPGEFLPPAPIENVPNTDLISGHGTFVAGIIAGNGAASGGLYDGVATDAKIVGLGAGEYNLTHVLAGFDYALKHRLTYGIRVINCSFSADTVYDTHDPVNIATKILTDNGISVVFSAGNKGDGSGTLNPYANAPWVISVGSTDETGKVSWFSSRGVFGKSGPTVVAPGESIVSLRSLPSMTGILGVAGADPDRLSTAELPFYTTANGTSFSAPQVAGAIALMLEVEPGLDTDEIKDILIRSATPSSRSYFNETGAGMLNTYGAVLESAFPSRHFGYFRAILDRSPVTFETNTNKIFGSVLSPGTEISHQFTVAPDTIRASSHISWGLSANDLSLKILNPKNQIAGESNRVNITALTGTTEKVNLAYPVSGLYTTAARHTAGVGTDQLVDGAIETTHVNFGNISDISDLTALELKAVKGALASYSMMPRSSKFYPNSKVSRIELADTLTRAGYAQQYLGGSEMFTDVVTVSERNPVESVQNHFRGPFFYDADPGMQFNPYQNVSRLVAAVALVRAANLEDETTRVLLRSNVGDRFSIPIQYRGHVAVALNRGLFKRIGKNFRPDRPLSRLDLAIALSKLP